MVSYPGIFSKVEILLNVQKNWLFYSEGNDGRANILGLSTTVVVTPVTRWLLTAKANYNYKYFKGLNGHNRFTSEINQLNFKTKNHLP